MKPSHAALLVVPALLAAAPGALGDSGATYTLQCGAKTYTVVKPNENSAVYTNGAMLFVTAIGAFKTDGAAQPKAVSCTINGFGPVPFIIPPNR